MAKKKAGARTSLRPIVTEINRARVQLTARQVGASPLQARRLRAGIRKLERLSALTRGICRGFFI
jgi:hypothetical protein